jgi:hypothetical protein
VNPPSPLKPAKPEVHPDISPGPASTPPCGPLAKGQHRRTHPGAVPRVTVVVLVPPSALMVPERGAEGPPSAAETEIHGSGPSSKVLFTAEATRLTAPGGRHTVVVVVVPRGVSTMLVAPLTVPEHHALKLKTFSVVHPASPLEESAPASPLEESAPASPLEAPLDELLVVPLDDAEEVPLDELVVVVAELLPVPESGGGLEELLLQPPITNKAPPAIAPSAAAQIVARCIFMTASVSGRHGAPNAPGRPVTSAPVYTTQERALPGSVGGAPTFARVLMFARLPAIRAAVARRTTSVSRADSPWRLAC